MQHQGATGTAARAQSHLLQSVHGPARGGESPQHTRQQEETGLFLLRLVEIIGEDKITDMDPETLYFIISALNQLDIDQLRNQILLKVLPLKV